MHSLLCLPLLLYLCFYPAQVLPWPPPPRQWQYPYAYRAVPNPSPKAIECGNDVSLSTSGRQWITSPDFPANYPPDTDCSWRIKAPFGARIRFILERFALQPSEQFRCKADYLEINDAGTKFKLCGFGSRSRQYVTVVNQVEVRFVSDSAWEHAGFRIRLEAFAGTCASFIHGVEKATISSPNYPFPYLSNMLCTWKIQVPEDQRVRLDCSEPFLLEGPPGQCQQDYFAVSITGDESFSKSKKYCSDQGPRSLESVQNTMTILFRTNRFYNFRGFRCQVTYATPRTSYSFPATSLPKCDCGKGNVEEASARIVQGEPTRPHAYPWMVGLIVPPGILVCGGSLISDRYVLTASHCFMQVRQPRLLKIAIGEHNVKDPTDGAVLYGVERIIQHPHYDQDSTLNDIALLRLNRPVTFGPRIQPICLPTAAMDLTGKSVRVIGWGKLTNEGPYSEVLQQVDLQVQPKDTCQKAYTNVISITTSMLCAGNGTKDSCQGDSGGPLMLQEGNNYIQVGVVSFGLDCGTQGVPGVYVRVDQYLDFIAFHALKSQTCVPLKGNNTSPTNPTGTLQSSSSGNHYMWTRPVELNRQRG